MSEITDRQTKDDFLALARLWRIARARLEAERREAGTWTPPAGGAGDGGERDDDE